MSQEAEAQQVSRQIEDLVGRIECITDPTVKGDVTALIQTLLDVHRRAFARVLEIILEEKESGNGILGRLSADELLGSLLVLYGLHPDSFDVRLLKAVEELRKTAAARGVNLELVGVDDGVVRIRLTGAAHGCASTSAGLRQLAEQAIYESVPEIRSVLVEDRMQGQGAERLVQLQIGLPAPQGA